MQKLPFIFGLHRSTTCLTPPKMDEKRNEQPSFDFYPSPKLSIHQFSLIFGRSSEYKKIRRWLNVSYFYHYSIPTSK